jgi:hypothetical protein
MWNGVCCCLVPAVIVSKYYGPPNDVQSYLFFYLFIYIIYIIYFIHFSIIFTALHIPGIGIEIQYMCNGVCGCIVPAVSVSKYYGSPFIHDQSYLVTKYIHFRLV